MIAPNTLCFALFATLFQIDSIPMDVRFGIYPALNVPVGIVPFPATLIAVYLRAELSGMNQKVTEETLCKWFDRYPVR